MAAAVDRGFVVEILARGIFWVVGLAFQAGQGIADRVARYLDPAGDPGRVVRRIGFELPFIQPLFESLPTG